MEHDMTDALDRRLRAARPRAAGAGYESVFDAELLARVREQPIAPRRAIPRAVAVPVAAGVTLTATAAVMLGGGPAEVGGPSSASAITQALHWLSPPAHTILHVRSIATSGGHTTTNEYWQSADDPTRQRLLTDGASTFETAGDGLYDSATNTIYDAAAEPRAGSRHTVTKLPFGLSGDPAQPVADPIVGKVRVLLQRGDMVVSGPETHLGAQAWAISLKPSAGRPVWTLWVSAADGRPLELRDPGRDANEAPQVIRWPTYEVLPDRDAGRLLTLTGAHPSAQVVHDGAQAAAAERRMAGSRP